MAIAINDNGHKLAFGFTASNGQVYYYADQAAREAIKAGTQLVSVSELPTASEDTMGKIYLVPASREGIAQNIKAEYVTVKNGEAYAWEKIGDTDLDLSGYSKVGHTHKVTSNVEVADAQYTPAGSNADSEVTFADNGDNKAQAISALPASTVPAYKLNDETKQKIKATASGADVNTEKKLVVASQDGIGSVTAGSDAELDGGSQAQYTQGAKAAFTQGAKAQFGTEVDENGIVSFNFTPNGDDSFTPNGDDTFTPNTLQSIKEGTGKATQVTLPTFEEQTIATGIKTQPSIALSLDAEGDVEVVTGQGSLTTDGTNAVSFGEATKVDVVKIGAKGVAAAQTFTGTEATLHHEVTNNEVTTGADIAPQA